MIQPIFQKKEKKRKTSSSEKTSSAEFSLPGPRPSVVKDRQRLQHFLKDTRQARCLTNCLFSEGKRFHPCPRKNSQLIYLSQKGNTTNCFSNFLAIRPPLGPNMLCLSLQGSLMFISHRKGKIPW